MVKIFAPHLEQEKESSLHSILIWVFLVVVALPLPALAAGKCTKGTGNRSKDVRSIPEKARLLDFFAKAPVRFPHGIPVKELQNLAAIVDRHPISSLLQLEKYDPTGLIGFCFGRSMSAHMEARRMGVSEAHIKKLFIIGDLRSTANPEWRFHVTTLVKAEDGKWYAVDPILNNVHGRPITVTAEDWIIQVRTIWDQWTGYKAKLYLTDADIVVPDLLNSIKSDPNRDIMDLNFKPENHSEIYASQGVVKPVSSAKFLNSNIKIDQPENYFRIYKFKDIAAQEKYFRKVGSMRDSEFNLETIRINGLNLDTGTGDKDVLSYNGFFIDLIRHSAKFSDHLPEDLPGSVSMSQGQPPLSLDHIRQYGVLPTESHRPLSQMGMTIWSIQRGNE